MLQAALLRFIDLLRYLLSFFGLSLLVVRDSQSVMTINDDSNIEIVLSSRTDAGFQSRYLVGMFVHLLSEEQDLSTELVKRYDRSIGINSGANPQ